MHPPRLFEEPIHPKSPIYCHKQWLFGFSFVRKIAETETAREREREANHASVHGVRAGGRRFKCRHSNNRQLFNR